MENNPSFNAMHQEETADSNYHDLVNNFEITYKITLPTEQLNALIHYHECFEIIFYISANIEAYIDDIHYDLHSQDVLVVPPRKLHKIIYPEKQNYIRYVFYFTEDHIKNAFSPTLVKKALHLFLNRSYQKASLSVPDFIRINSLFSNMYHHKSQLSPANLYLLNTYSSVILQELYVIFKNLPAYEKAETDMSPVEQILKYINGHYSEGISLEDFEKIFYLDKSYICRVFRKTMGISLVNYLQHKRILEAQQLLLNSDESIIDISLECGFNNIQHFYRVFKKVTHLTPNEFKKHQTSSVLGQSFVPLENPQK